MNKTCEICGRQIKTGRKYCWEHRHTSEFVKGDKLLQQATNAFYCSKVKRRNEVKTFKTISMFFGLLIGITLFSIGSIFLFILGILIIAFSFFPPKFMYRLFKIRDWEKEAMDLINKKSPEYIAFVKEYVKKHKQEKEFKKSLLS